jgi:adenylosuccinate synthase
MRHICVVGLNWGDEGKGKIVDVLSSGVDAVVRYQGGANAGHTVWIGEEKIVLHHLPMGILHDGVQAVLGNGMVVEPRGLLEEVDSVARGAIDRLWLSERAHLVLPHHVALDRTRESGDGVKIGTTLRGIGPAYQEKSGRAGVRLGDLVRPGFIEERLTGHIEERARGLALPPGAIDESVAFCRRIRDTLGGRIVDTRALLVERDRRGERFLFEGAQGALLDLDFGTYPFVTSSSPSFLGLGPGSGFSPRRIDHVIGVTKAYWTRVGEGPFPSEIHGEEAEALRAAGSEYGATTGRPRRIGWLDLPALRYTVALNDLDSIALTKSDVLSGRRTVPIAVSYRIRGRTTADFPTHAEELRLAEPVIEEWPGWTEVSERAMRPFLERLAAAAGVPVAILSTGRRREDTVLFEPFASSLGTLR